MSESEELGHSSSSVADRIDRRTRLHVVSGKGGTGKTTVAGALALALARGGRRVLLLEVEGRQGIAQLFDVPPLPYEERRIALAPEGGAVFALAVDTEAALLDYLEMFYNARRAGGALRRLGAVDFATTIAPGVRDVLLTGKATEAVRRRNPDGSWVYDSVVMDAPPTGRIARFLNVTHEVAGIAKVGPIRNQSDLVMGVIRSPQTSVHLVTLLEEMPVQETIDGFAELRALNLPCGAAIVNMVKHEYLPPDALAEAEAGDLPLASIERDLTAAGIRPKARAKAVARVLAQEATDHAARVALERDQLERLSEIDEPVVTLPFIPGGVDLAALYDLADDLSEQLVDLLPVPPRSPGGAGARP